MPPCEAQDTVAPESERELRPRAWHRVALGERPRWTGGLRDPSLEDEGIGTLRSSAVHGPSPRGAALLFVCASDGSGASVSRQPRAPLENDTSLARGLTAVLKYAIL